MKVKMGKIDIYLIIVIFLVGVNPSTAFSQNGDKSDKLPAEFASHQEKQMIPVQEAILKLERHYDVIFLYDSQLINDKRVQYKEPLPSDVLEAANELLQGYEVRVVRLNDHSYAILPESRPQKSVLQHFQVEIEGTVTDASTGETLPGVNILVKETSTGASTDQNGNFELEVPSLQDTLVVTYIGYQRQEVPIDGRTELDIQLTPEAIMGEEMVVVGYGMQERESVTGSVAQVSSDDIMQSPVGNVSGMLTGKLPGLVSRQSSGIPGSDQASMTIRGPSSFASSNSPVIIVDGVRRSFNQLDPEEIESVTVLKDASAAAVYGLEAAAGVILVTTKKGSRGAPSIRFSSSVSKSQNTMFPEFLDGPEYAYWHNKARTIYGEEPLFSDSDIQKMKEGDPEGKWGNTNWVDELFESGSGLTTHNGITVDGGSDRVRYYIYGGFYNQEGNVKNLDFERYNVRSNIDVEVAENLQASIGLSGRKEIRKAPRYNTNKNGFGNLITQAIRAKPYLPKTYDGYPTANQAGGNLLVSPIAALEESGFRRNYRNLIQTQIKLDWDLPWLTQGLTLSALGSYDYRQSYGKVFSSPYKVAQAEVGPNGISYKTVESSLGKTPKLAENMTRAGTVTLQGSINYSNTFGKHEVSGLVLYEQFRRLSNSISIATQGLDFLELPELRFATELVPSAGAFGGGSSIFPNAGFVSRFNYAYDNKYLVEFSGRYDASYKFNKDNRWTLFPAASLGWRLSEETFFKDHVSFVNNLKLRASWGRLGNDSGVGAYTYLASLVATSDAPSVVVGSTPKNAYRTSVVPNPDLSWETATIYNLGLEADLWDDILGIEIDAFYKVTDDILESQGGTFPPSIGGYFPSVINTGKTDSKGFELALDHNHQIGDFSYSIKSNVSWYRNRILEIRESPNTQDHLKRNGNKLGQKHGLVVLGIHQTDEEAQNWPSLFGNPRAGDFKYKDVNGDGKITYQDDREWIADSNIPQLMSSLTFVADYKNFNFSLMLQGAAMSEYALSGFYPGRGYSTTEFTRPFYADGNAPKYLVEKMWTPDNPDAEYGRLSYFAGGLVRNNNWASTKYIVNGSYLRIKSAQLGYTVPKSIVGKAGVKSLRLHVSGGNLYTWTEFPYLDPEAPDVSNGFYPQQRVFSIGMDIKF